jgi:FkbM family methyltransferase
VPENGTIVVAGAYKGRYLHYLSEMFPTAWLYGYEPQKEAFMEAKSRLGDKAHLFNKGLSTSERMAAVGSYGTDGCSALSNKGARNILEMFDAVEALDVSILAFRVSIDLLILNCEGSEWALIPYLMIEMMHHRIASMAIQFHPEYVSPQRAARVRDYLSEYYSKTYEDTNNWTYWKRDTA